VKYADGQIVSVLDEKELTEEQKKTAEAMTAKSTEKTKEVETNPTEKN